MTNEEKARKLFCKNCDIKLCGYCKFHTLIKMAEWKDKQFIDLLYKWMSNGKIDITSNIEDLIKEINGEN